MPDDQPATLRLRLLGPVDVSGSAGAGRLLEQPKLLMLCAYVVIAGARGFLPRERVMSAFWPEQSTERARASLRTAIYSLRELLGTETVTRRGDLLAPDPGRFTCDAYEFTDAMQRDELARALELYRGPLLEGLYADTAELQHWLDDAREQFRVSAADAAWMLAERYESAASDLTSASRWARRAARLASSDERRIRKVMALLDRAGDTAGAIGVYEEFTRFLARDLDLQPSLETQELARALRERNSR